MKARLLLSSSLVCFLFVGFFSTAGSDSSDPLERFLGCIASRSDDFASFSKLIFTPGNSSYASVLDARIGNPIFGTPSTPKPMAIVTPTNESQIRAVVFCTQKHGLEFRIRSGGHDYEGISYTAPVPFVMLDLYNMRAIDIDVESKTAWIQTGANLGELYYRISQHSRMLGFPAGTWFKVGVGGHISGGGFGDLVRKYGVSPDHVIDAHFMDVKCRILDRKSMGEDLFWAIRGGGGSSFGVILAWKVSLVEVPEVLTVFEIDKTLEENGTFLFHKWQTITPAIDRDLLLRVQLQSVIIGNPGRKTVLISFRGFFQGRMERLLALMQKEFPELGVTRESCAETSWIQTVLLSSNFSIETPPETLLNRSAAPEKPIKMKSDFIQEPIPIEGLEGLWSMLLENDVGTLFFLLTPFGGRMAEVPESAIPFPHRGKILYCFLEAIILDVERPEVTGRRVQWLRSFHSYFGRYATKSPRQAYVNGIDLDLGVGAKSYREASRWGTQYFQTNFHKLVRVKSKVDPKNFFKHPQSIPSFQSF